MTNELTKIIVKVGNKSNVKFSHCKMYRAILANDLSVISKANPDCNIVIIENISEDEQEVVKNFAFEFNNIDEKHNVLFFIPDNDNITSGIADELDYNIYLTLDDLYKAIYDIYNINVSTFIADKAKYNSVASESDIPGMDFGDIPSFGEAMGEDIEEPVEDTGTDISETDDNTEEIATTESTEKISLVKEEDTTTVEVSETDSDDVLALKREINDLKYDYKQAVKDIKELTEQTNKLEEIIRVLKEEKDDMIARYNAIMSDNDVIEEPISLDEYEKLSKEIEQKDESIKSLEGNLENIKSSLSDCKNQLELSNDNCNNYEKTIEKLNAELEELRGKIESGELLQGTIDEYSAKLSDNETIISELRESEKVLKETIDEEVKYRLALSEETDKLVKQLADTLKKVSELESSLVEANESIEEFRSKYETANEQVENLTVDNTNSLNEITTLKQELESANKRAELANSYADSEKKDAEDRILELETNLKIVQEQLEHKESQYKDLVEQSKNSSNESVTLANANNNLDMMNKTLREKLGAVTKELEAHKNNKIEMQNKLKQYQTQVQRLTDTLNSVSMTGGMPSMTAGSIQKALYTESAQIITVFGSGSFGITTTAMSLADKLSSTSKVLYIDFDLVNAKADTWFSKVPICKGISGIPSNDNRMSALGIFFELGIDTFMKYSASIIHQCDRTKGGGIDYLSGVYYRVDAHKVAEADYSALLNFLGSMYQYIIIDLGRLGSSEVNDNLIKVLSDIATRNVVVTTSDKFEVRNFRWKLNENKINLNSIAWLINMCENTNVDEKTKQSILPCDFGFMLNDYTLHGNREKFTRNRVNKDKLDLFVNTVLFAKRK